MAPKVLRCRYCNRQHIISVHTKSKDVLIEMVDHERSCDGGGNQNPRENAGIDERLGRSPLHVAALNGDVPGIMAIMGKKHPWSHANYFKGSKCTLCDFSNEEELARGTHFWRSRLSHGLVLKEKDAKGNTALHLAMMKGHWKAAEYLINRSSKCPIKDEPNWINIRNEDGKTPWMLAEEHVNEKRRGYALADEWGHTLIHLVASYRGVEELKLLLDERPALLKVGDDFGSNVAMFLVDDPDPERRLDKLKMVLKKDKLIHREANTWGNTLMHWASRRDKLKLLTKLVEHEKALTMSLGPSAFKDSVLNKPARYGESPVFQARTSEAVEVFLSFDIPEEMMRLVRKRNRDHVMVDQPLLHHCCSVITQCPFLFTYTEGCRRGSQYHDPGYWRVSCDGYDHLSRQVIVALKDQLNHEWTTLTPLELAIEKGNNFRILFEETLRLYSQGEMPPVDHDDPESPRSIMRLFSGSRYEERRLKAFRQAVEKVGVVLRNQENRWVRRDTGIEFLTSIRGKIARAICNAGLAKLFWEANYVLGFTYEDVVESLPGQYSCLWIAADIQNAHLVDQILAIEAVCDDFVERDGTTAFAIALGHQNAEVVKTFLTCNPSDQALRLAREVLRSDDVDEKTSILKSSIRSLLWINYDEEEEEDGHAPALDRDRILLTKRYPIFNGDAEKACPFVTATDQEMQQLIDRNNCEVDTGDFEPFLLKKFCIDPREVFDSPISHLNLHNNLQF